MLCEHRNIHSHIQRSTTMKPITSALLPLLLSFLLLQTLSANLTDSMIEKWMRAYPTVEAWMEANEDVLDPLMDTDEAEMMSLDQLMLSGFKAMQSHPIYQEFKKVIKPLGYSNDADFIHDTVAIFKAFTAISVKEEMNEMGGFDLSALQSQLKEIDQMQGLSADQKAMMKQQLQSAMGQMGAFLESVQSVSESDIQTLMPYFHQIAALFDSESED